MPRSDTVKGLSIKRETGPVIAKSAKVKGVPHLYDFDDLPPQRLMFRKAFVSVCKNGDFIRVGLLL